MESIQSRHTQAKYNIRQIVNVLVNERKVDVETAKLIFEQLLRIEEDALSLFQDYSGRQFEFVVGIGKDKKVFKADIKIEQINNQ